MKSRKLLLAFALIIAGLIGTIGGILSAQYSFAHNLFVTPVSAQEPSQTSSGVDPRQDLLEAGVGFGDPYSSSASVPRDPRYIVASLIRTALTFVGITLVILVIYAGYLWWSAGGNDDKVTKAKATLRNALIGLLIVGLSYGLVTYFMQAVFEAAFTGGPSYFDPEYR